MQVEFPLFVCAKDSGEVRCFESVYTLQNELEEIDVENGEYLAWDKKGWPVTLGLQTPIWLTVESRPDLKQGELKHCLEEYAATLGVCIELKDLSPEEFERALKELATVARQKARRSFLTRLLGGLS